MPCVLPAATTLHIHFSCGARTGSIQGEIRVTRVPYNFFEICPGTALKARTTGCKTSFKGFFLFFVVVDIFLYPSKFMT